MAWALFIDDVDVTEFVTAGTLKVSTPAIGRAQLDVTLVSDTGYKAEKRKPVRLEQNSVVKFGGFTDTVDIEIGGEYGAGATDQVIVCVDNNWLADRIPVTTTFAAGSTVADILEYFVSGDQDDLSNYGVTTDPLQPDVVTITEALDFTDLAISGWFSRVADFCAKAGTPVVISIGPDLVLRAYAVGSVNAPWDVADDNGRVDGALSVKESDREYHNRVIYKFGPTGPHNITDTFTADGTTDTFTLTAKITGPVPGTNASGAVGQGVLYVNGLQETLFIAGTGGAQWAYTDATHTIQRTAGNPSNGDVIVVTYQGDSPASVMVEDAGEIADEGLDVVIIRDEFTTTAEMALALASSALAKFLEQPKTLRYQTTDEGLEAGQVQHIQNSELDVDTDALITDLEMTDGGGDMLIYDVTLEEGSRFRGSWRDVPIAWLAGAGGGAAGTAGIVSPPIPGGAAFWYTGDPHPQGFMVAPVGSLYLRTDGRRYWKLGGGSTAFGWFPEWGPPFEYTVYAVYSTANTGSAATAGGIQASAFALTGNLTTVNAADNDYIGSVARLTTAVTANSNANIRPGGASNVRVGNEFDLWAYVWLGPDITSYRAWVGLDESGGAFNNGDTPGAGIARYAFRFSTAVPDSGWVGQVSDGTTTSTTSSLKTAVAGELSLLRIRGDRSTGSGTNPTIYFSVDNGPETQVTGIPNSEEQMEWGISVWNLTGSARSLDFQKLICMEGNGMNIDSW